MVSLREQFLDYSKNGHLARNWYWTIGCEMKNREMNDIEINVNSKLVKGISKNTKQINFNV